jgi:hypothetical protein
MEPVLRPEDLEVVDEALEEIKSQEGPVDRGPIGCVMALPAFVVLLVLPVLGRRFDLPSSVATPILVGAIALLIVGLVLWFTAGGFVRGHVIAAAEAALRALEEWSPEAGHRDEALRAATLLVMNAYASYGPTTTRTFDAAEARERVSGAMPLVEAVERHLVDEGVTYRVFTEGEEGEDDEAPAGPA